MIDKQGAAALGDDRLHQDAANHAEREEREALEDAAGGVWEDRDLRAAESEQHEVADADGQADDGDVPGEGVDGVAGDGLAAGGGAFVRKVDAAPLVHWTLVEGADFAHIAMPVGPVYKNHAHDDADDHADGGHR